MIDKLNNNRFLIFGVFIYLIVIIQVTILDLHLPFIVCISSVILIVIGIKYPLFGLLFSFATMNSFFDLVPKDLITDYYISKTWDFGFLYLLIIVTPLVFKNWPLLITIKFPLYFKLFIFYLAVCFFSLLFTIYKYPFPIIDTIRTFRYHFGYLLIPFIILSFYKPYKGFCFNNFTFFLRVLYIFCFALLVLYIIQFLSNVKIFHGYNREIIIGGKSYIRSIPNFLNICYFFLWFNLSAWFTNKKMYPAGTIYIALCLISNLFTFTRGIYVSVTFFTILIFILHFLLKRFSSGRFLLSIFIIITVTYTAFLTDFLDPFINRASTIKETTLIKYDSTFWYRINLLNDRIKITNKENPIIGLGFVHNKYGYQFGKFEGNYDQNINERSLSCADIAFANILYRTGWIGFVVFLLFIISIIGYVVNRLKMQNRFRENDILEIAAIIELLRNFLHMFNSDSFTGSTIHNPALLLGILLFLYNYDYKFQKRFA